MHHNKKLPSTFSQAEDKKRFIMILCNSGDIDGLLKMLESNFEEDIILQIIISLGTLANSKAIPHLTEISKASYYSTDTKLAAQNAIQVIKEFSNYST
jgi:hypothetical protein